MAPSSALPIGATRVVDETQLEEVDPSLDAPICLHAIVSVHTGARPLTTSAAGSPVKEEDSSAKPASATRSTDDAVDAIAETSSIGFLYM